MYTTAAIEALANRIGWAQPIPPTQKTLTAENAVGTSGRLFNSFHQLCIVENVEATMPVSGSPSGYDVLVSNQQLNDKLKEFRDQAARKVLNRIFDINPLAQYRTSACGRRQYIGGTDYSDIIIGRAANLDDLMGYQVAYDVMQMMLMPQRSNRTERSIAEAGAIMAQLNGFRNAQGQLVEDGILQKLENAYTDAIGIFFESQSVPTVRNASALW